RASQADAEAGVALQNRGEGVPQTIKTLKEQSHEKRKSQRHQARRIFSNDPSARRRSQGIRSAPRSSERRMGSSGPDAGRQGFQHRTQHVAKAPERPVSSGNGGIWRVCKTRGTRTNWCSTKVLG